MHNFLKAIGFSNIDNQKDLDEILLKVMADHDKKMVVEMKNGHYYGELSRDFANDCGITVCGEYDENDVFHMEYYFPYFRGSEISTTEPVSMTRHAQRESYAGSCDDVRLGITLIFYLLNTADYLSEKEKGFLPVETAPVSLSGLSSEGTILLPINKNMKQREESRKSMVRRNQLIDAARKGDTDAQESLTYEDIDTYTMITQRLINEDVFSIVDTYFMPYGVECDQYSIMGEIIDFIEVSNSLSGEKMYQLCLACNDINLDVCINQKDLLGEPEIGRRFKGLVWLQGHLDF